MPRITYVVVVTSAVAIAFVNAALPTLVGADEPAKESTAPLAPWNADQVRWQGHHGDMPQSSLDVEITPNARARRTPAGIRLPVRIVNRSPRAITTRLGYEWDPGLFHVTDLYASVTWQEEKPFWPALLIGTRPRNRGATITVEPNAAQEIELRMDGTGSFGRDSFMEIGIPGAHRARLLLVFEAEGKQQFVVSKQYDVDLRNTPLTELTQPHEGARLPIRSEPMIADELRNELVNLDAMRKGLDTNLDDVDRAGQRLLEKFTAADEQAQIYVQLAHVYAQSGLRKPDQMIAYIKEALKHSLPLQQSLILCTNWGDGLRVRSQPLTADSRLAAATAYVLGLKQLTAYDIPATFPHLPDAPPIPNGIPEDREGLRKLNRYQQLRHQADFIRELIVQKDILLRQLKDTYDARQLAAGDRQPELEKFKRLAREQLGDDAAALIEIIESF